MERLVLWHRTLPPPFEDNENAAAYGAWATQVADAMSTSGGKLLSALAGTVVGAFAVRDLETVVHLALRLLAEAERQNVPSGGLAIAFGIATGEVHQTYDSRGQRASVGSAIDRAQILANQARGGELVLDVEARQAASRTFLFGRAVSTSSFALRGEAIDRKLPLRSECRKFVRHLQHPGVPLTIRSALAPIEAAAMRPHTQVFKLTAPDGSESRDAMLQLAARLHPPLWFELGPVPGALEPLGSLRLALLRQWDSPAEVRRAIERFDPAAAETLEAVASADPPPRKKVADALRVLFRAHTTQDKMPWLYLERVAAIDRATFSLLDEVLQDDHVAALVVQRASESDTHVECLESLPTQTLELPALTRDQAAQVAAKVLREPEDSALAASVGLTGGDTTRGIIEAARTLVSSGDLVCIDSRFAWRQRPRSESNLATASLVEERILALEEDPLRALEVVCAALPASCKEVFEAAMESDGLSADRCLVAIRVLRGERFITAELAPDSEVLRRVVIRRMPAARRSEVYRFVGDALASKEPYPGPALSATVGAYWCEGGETAKGVRALLKAGVMAATRGYTRAAVRLAAAAVQLQPDQNTRSEASKIRHSVAPAPAVYTQAEVDPEAAIRPTEPPAAAEQSVLEALKSGQHGAFDALIEGAIAGGANLAVAHCLRAVSYANRGDFQEADRCLRDARRYANGNAGARLRLSLTTSWLLLLKAYAEDAALHSMDALALSKEQGDVLGQTAALKMLALCYRARGYESAATALEQRSAPASRVPRP